MNRLNRLNRPITRRHRLASALLPIVLSLPLAAHAAQADEPERQSPAAEADAADTQQPSLLKPKSRLRFRGNGPTCMCADGLREKDIRAAKPRSNDTDTQTQSTDP